jgi:pyrroloquinoline-quinone synthase
MDTLGRIDALIQERHLLTHPFYTKWVAGTLPVDAVQDYARQYYAFESSFPRFLSAIHTQSADPEVRRAMLDNLWDEEHGEENHAELWLRFAEGIGAPRAGVQGAKRSAATDALLDTYAEASARGPVAGVAAVHAYEQQVPAVAEAKIDGLRTHYGVTDHRTLAFWEVHRELDVEHAGAERAILKRLADSDPEAATTATSEALEAWWGFLDSVDPD